MSAFERIEYELKSDNPVRREIAEYLLNMADMDLIGEDEEYLQFEELVSRRENGYADLV